MKVSYNITQNKFNASLNQETTEIKVSFKTGYYPFPSDLDISNLVPYNDANKDVNIASNYFKTSKGFDFTFDENNYFRSFHLGSLYSQLDFSSNSSEFGYFKIIGNAEIGLNIFQNENYFSIQNNFTVSTKPFLTDSGFRITNGTPNLSLTADGGTFDLNEKADLVDGKVPSSQLPSYNATDVDALKRDGSNANSNIDIGEFQLKAGQIELDQTPTQPFGVGMIRWNDTDGTAEIRLKGNNVTLQLGQELVKRVVNKSGANLLESQYKVVKIVGATGQRLSIDLAQANNELNSATTIGMVTENINNNQEGFITYSGEVNGINTTGSLQGETWEDGDVLYLSPSVAGGVTKVKPTAPNHVVIVGYVEYAHVTKGKIFIKIDNGYELDEIHNVNTSLSKTNLVDDDNLLIQDSADSSIWKKISWSNIKATLKTSFTHDILVSNWTWVSGKYEAVISNAGILSNSFVDVIPSDDNVDIVIASQIYLNVLISEGNVKVYSKYLPSGTISVTINIY